jgi:hypothetical protein
LSLTVDNGHALDGWAIYDFLLERLLSKLTKSSDLIHSLIENFQPGTTAQ